MVPRMARVYPGPEGHARAPRADPVAPAAQGAVPFTSHGNAVRGETVYQSHPLPGQPETSALLRGLVLQARRRRPRRGVRLHSRHLPLAGECHGVRAAHRRRDRPHTMVPVPGGCILVLPRRVRRVGGREPVQPSGNRRSAPRRGGRGRSAPRVLRHHAAAVLARRAGHHGSIRVRAVHGVLPRRGQPRPPGRRRGAHRGPALRLHGRPGVPREGLGTIHAARVDLGPGERVHRPRQLHPVLPGPHPLAGQELPGLFRAARGGRGPGAGRRRPIGRPPIHRFASYTGARVTSAELRGRDLFVTIRDRQRVLRLHAERSHEGVLLAPVDGAMERRIAESIDARISVRLEDTSGRILFEGAGGSAGLEIVGDPSLIGVRA